VADVDKEPNKNINTTQETFGGAHQRRGLQLHEMSQIKCYLFMKSFLKLYPQTQL